MANFIANITNTVTYNTGNKKTDDPDNLKANGNFEVYYSSSPNAPLGYGEGSGNLSKVASLEIWAQRGNVDKKSKITLDDSTDFSIIPSGDSGKRWTVTYNPSDIPGVSRPQGDDPKNVQVNVGSNGQ